MSNERFQKIFNEHVAKFRDELEQYKKKRGAPGPGFTAKTIEDMVAGFSDGFRSCYRACVLAGVDLEKLYASANESLPASPSS